MDYEIFSCFEKHVDFDGLESGTHIFKKNRYHTMHGGRGGGKSVFTAKTLTLEAYFDDIQILCAREFQNSINDSVMALIWEQIEDLGLEWFFTKTKTEIVGQNGSRFFFRGLKTNVTSIKSIARIDRVWLEEAESVSEDSWSILTPSIRTPGARIIITFNPFGLMDATYQRFVVNPPTDSIVTRCLFSDNPHFPDALNQERLDMKASDPDLYEWVWGGTPIGDSPLSIIPAKWVRAAVDIHKKLGIDTDGHKQLGFDVSGGGADANATALVEGQVLTNLQEFRQSDPTSASHDAFKIAVEHSVNAFIYDGIGVGSGTGQTVAEDNFNNTTSKGLGKNGIVVESFNAAAAVENPHATDAGNSKKNKDNFLNLKAQMWWKLRYMFQQCWLASQGQPYNAESILSICSDSIDADLVEKLIFECSSPRREYLGSKLRVEPKEKLLKRGIKSHNLADALVMATWRVPTSTISSALSARRARKRSR